MPSTASKRTLVINLRVTADEKEQIEENAKAYGQSVSDFLRKQATLSELDLEPIDFEHSGLLANPSDRYAL